MEFCKLELLNNAKAKDVISLEKKKGKKNYSYYMVLNSLYFKYYIKISRSRYYEIKKYMKELKNE